MIEPRHPQLSLRRQSRLLRVNRNHLESKPRALSSQDKEEMKTIHHLHEKYPVYGARKISHFMRQKGSTSSRHRVTRLMGLMGLKAITTRARTSQPFFERRQTPLSAAPTPHKSSQPSLVY